MIGGSRSLEMDQDVEMPASTVSSIIFGFFLMMVVCRIKRLN